MAEDGGNPSPYMTRADCAKIMGRIDLALFGEDGRNGMVKDISDITHHLHDIKKWRQEDIEKNEEKGRDWRDVARTIVAGGAIAVLTWVLAHVLP